jgi:TolB-like protein/Tfp pilus assembly protein PilF
MAGAMTLTKWRGLFLGVCGIVASAHLSLAQCPDGAPPPCAGRAVRPASPTSVAVLYFENASPDSTDAYLADGITEEIISRLGGVGRIQVKSRYLVRRYRTDSNNSPVDIGRQLAVASIVTGSVRRAGNRVRVTAEMVRSTSGDVVWSEHYDRSVTDVLALQDELASAVAAAITGRLLPAERELLVAQPTRSAAAYDAYLLGRFYWGKRTAADLVRAAASFQQAIRADSNYAQAWSGLADSYVLFIPAEYDVPGINTDSILNLAERSARRAVAIDPRVGEAWTSLGEILEYRLKWIEAQGAFERGIALSPNYPTAHLWYAYDLMVWNRWDEAIREMNRARELDPLSIVTLVSLASAYAGAERWDDANATNEQALAMSPENSLALWLSAAEALIHRDFDRFGTDYLRMQAGNSRDSANAALVRRALLDPLKRDSTLRTVGVGTAQDRGVFWQALVHRALDGDDSMIDYLSHVMTNPVRGDTGGAILYCFMGPRLRADPRMHAALARIGYPAL